ncbi:MAG: hypothetical protein RLZ79_1612 [Pseudomonadota bacterium]
MSRFPHVEFLLSVAAPVQFPPDAGAEVAIAGRSNAGKSSAINAIAERKALARTSKTPGQTRLLNYFELEESHRIVDLPGYGYAAVRPDERRKWVPLIDALRARTIEWADPTRRGVHVLLSKADKLNQAERAAVLKDSRAQLGSLASVQVFSAHSGLGVKEAQTALAALWERNKKTPDGP